MPTPPQRRVLVTGATGFVGSHVTAALVRDGQRVRVLARNPEKVPAALEPHGIDATEVEVAVGDMTDEAAVAAALDGCDAVVHAAAEIGVDGGSGPTSTANVDGVRTVIGAAVDLRLDPIVYTSSVMAHLPNDGSAITPDSPLAEPLSSYGESKHRAELLVRDWQAQGAPIVSFTIGGVYGPTSPHLNSSFAAIAAAMGLLMLTPPGGSNVVDVRDLAVAITRALEPGRGPRRYVAGGAFLTWPEWVEALSEGAGVPVASQEIDAEGIIAMGRQFDEQRAAGEDLGPFAALSEEAAIVMTCGVPTDDSATLADLGVTWRPTADTFRDAVEFMRRVGALEVSS
ncbi:MAG: SDR family NAD(P)-dependent oxidoreductase [Actinobacteria bacterium]|nr:SDR family NAD(P)-dependent oxidoreductase [Actinomycetota bacterium]